MGPLGLVLSTPLTIVLVVLGQHVSRLEFLDIMFSDRPALEPHEVFYQRMLAGDPVEARLQARDFLRDRTLAEYCDEIVLPALRRAHVDIMRGLVEGERLSTVLVSFEALLADLSSEKQRAEAVEEGRRFLLLHSDDPLDNPAGRMLAETLRQEGASVILLSMTDARAAAQAQRRSSDCVVLCFFEPLSAQHMRAAARAVRRTTPGARLMVCVWQDMGSAQVEELRRKLHVPSLAIGVSDALRKARAALPPATPAPRPDEGGAPSLGAALP